MDFTFALQTSYMDENEELQARMHACDADALGVDEFVVKDDWSQKTPFPEVVAHLLMFDPEWLFSRPWVGGWVVTPIESPEVA